MDTIVQKVRFKLFSDTFFGQVWQIKFLDFRLYYDTTISHDSLANINILSEVWCKKFLYRQMSYNIHALACTGSAMIQFPFSGTCLQRKSKKVHQIVQIYDEVYVDWREAYEYVGENCQDWFWHLDKHSILTSTKLCWFYQ